MKLALTTIFLLLFTIPYLSSQSYTEIRQDLNKHRIYHSIKEALTEPEKVYRLNLSNTEIDEQTLEDALPKFHNLRELQLSNTFIYKIPTSIGELQHLQFLDVEHLNKQNLNLLRIPKSIQKLKELVSINLIGNPNIDWHETFLYLSELPKLVNIALMNNNFRQLAVEITRLSSLEMIWLGKNPNLELEHTFLLLSKLNSLSQLGLGGNGHTELSPQISLLKNVQNLWLSGNKWKNLDGIQHLPKLTQLSLHNCYLNVFPEAITQCGNIEYLSLVGNPDLDFDEVLKQLPPSLSILNLSTNRIKKLSIDNLKKINLATLILKNNNIPDRDIVPFQEANKNLEIIFR